MENYYITNNTIALLKKEKSTIIYDVDNSRVINKNIKKIINMNCILYGCTLEGRINCAKKLINREYKLPIYINDNIMLVQLDSLRKKECLFIVLNKIIAYKYNNSNLEIFFENNNKFVSKISLYSFETLIINGFLLNNIINLKNSYFSFKCY